jgi:Ca2+-binding RTX toxin-like protein
MSLGRQNLNSYVYKNKGKISVMTTLTTTGSVDAIASTSFSVFLTDFGQLANGINSTFKSIDLLNAASSFEPAQPITSTLLVGYDPVVSGELHVTGQNLNHNFSLPVSATGTITSVSYQSGADPGTGAFVPDGVNSFSASGTFNWSYVPGSGTNLTGSMTSISVAHNGGVGDQESLQITGTGLSFHNGGNIHGTVTKVVLEENGLTITLTGSVNADNTTGNFTSISFADAQGSVTLSGTIAAADFLNDTLDSTFGDYIQHVLSSSSNEVLHVTDSSVVWEGRAGNDTIIASGGGDFTLSGGAGNDVLTGSSGNDTLDGGTGADTTTCGGGDDTYFVDNALDKVIEGTLGGNDTIDTVVSYTLSANVENLVLNHSGITGTGNALSNVITDTVGGNTLDGGAGGNDTLIGLVGGDTFVFHSDPTTITATGEDNTVIVLRNNTGTTALTAHVTDFTNIQNITIKGTGLFDIEGDSNDNVLTGNASVNVITGGGGNDTLDGGLGADMMIGGTGNDIFHVDNVGDVVVSGGGHDAVVLSMTTGTFSMASGIDALTMTGTGALHAVGNGEGDVITGNSGANVI